MKSVLAVILLEQIVSECWDVSIHTSTHREKTDLGPSKIMSDRRRVLAEAFASADTRIEYRYARAGFRLTGIFVIADNFKKNWLSQLARARFLVKGFELLLPHFFSFLFFNVHCLRVKFCCCMSVLYFLIVSVSACMVHVQSPQCILPYNFMLVLLNLIGWWTLEIGFYLKTAN